MNQTENMLAYLARYFKSHTTSHANGRNAQWAQSVESDCNRLHETATGFEVLTQIIFQSSILKWWNQIKHRRIWDISK